jgi:hypothetical protein
MKIRHLVAAAAALGWMAFPAPTAACPLMMLDARMLASADVAFVGIVQGVDQRVARISVIEVWRGPDLPAQVDLVVGDGQPPGLSTGDRTFEVGMRYLFVPYRYPDGLQDSVCSLTQPWTPELAAVRPAGARPPTAASADVGFPGTLLAAAAALLVLAVVGVVAFRRGSR